LLIVEHSGVQGFGDVAELLTSVGVKQLGPLLLVLLPFNDSLAVSFKLIELIFELCPLQFVNSETILGNRLFNRANHFLFFLFEDLSDLFGDHFFFKASAGLTQSSVDRVG
jgi:hypothetical protein